MSLKTVKAGDLIQYRYCAGAFTNYDARVVEMVDEAGCWVNGGYLVRMKDVLFVMPAPKADLSPITHHLSTDFPMEATQ